MNLLEIVIDGERKLSDDWLEVLALVTEGKTISIYCEENGRTWFYKDLTLQTIKDESPWLDE